MNKFKSATSFRFSVNNAQQQAREMINLCKHGTEDCKEECVKEHMECKEHMEHTKCKEDTKIEILEPTINVDEIYESGDKVESNDYDDLIVKLKRRPTTFKKVVSQAMDKFILKKKEWN